jgi:PAS domain-containing protein
MIFASLGALFRLAELLVCLPADWPVTEEAFEDERNYWPVRWLKQVARFVHEYKTLDPKGETFWIELRATPLKDKNGNLQSGFDGRAAYAGQNFSEKDNPGKIPLLGKPWKVLESR